MTGLLEWLRGGSLRAWGPLGARGERVAERWLRRRGYRIVNRNFSIGDDEIDLLALDPDGRTLVLVEVKTRSADAPAGPEESVGIVKQRRLARVASRLLQTKRYQGMTIRFDVIAIVWPENGEPQVKHIPAAFESPF